MHYVVEYTNPSSFSRVRSLSRATAIDIYLHVKRHKGQLINPHNVDAINFFISLHNHDCCLQQYCEYTLADSKCE